MDGVREVQISIEYQVYCLFYCFESFLKFETLLSNMAAIQMDKWKVYEKASFFEVKTTA